MKVYFEIPELREKTAVAIGTFDGVHLGHQSVLHCARQNAINKNYNFVVFTFLDHPAIVTGSKKVPQLLTTSEEKIALLEKYNIDYCIIPPFSKEFSLLTPEAFIKTILVEKLKAKDICIGFNFFFGHKAAGSGVTLNQLSNKYNYESEIVAPVMFENNPVSSSLIRKLLSTGDIEKANQMLGYEYYLKGSVIKGKGIGRSVLGIPTANLLVNERKLLPGNGVYSCEVKLRGKKYLGVLNIGNRPTFDNGAKSVEVHILDFADDIYDEILELNFKSFLRKEKKFSDIEQLKKQILSDIDNCSALFSAKINII